MDLVALAHQATEILAPALPFIYAERDVVAARVHDMVLEKGLEKAGSKFIDITKILYDKIRSKGSKPVEIALEELSKNPENSKARENLQQEMLGLFKENPDLAKEIEHIIININAENIDQLTVGSGNSSYSFKNISGDLIIQFINYSDENSIENININELVKRKKSTQIGMKSSSLVHSNTEISFPEITTNLDTKIQNKNSHDEPLPLDFPKTFISPCTNMEFVLISTGKFMMGIQTGGSAIKKVLCHGNESPYHEVHIKYQFYLGKFPVTQKQWSIVMGKNPSKDKGETKPVTEISWYDVQEFIKRLNDIEGTNKYRLPSEAEWEYACRAGTKTMYFFGDDNSNSKDYAWYKGYSGVHPVGQKKPNPWGLYDMHGNVCEWVQDSWHDSYKGVPSDGSAWEDKGSSIGVRRGGSHYDFLYLCSSASRISTKFNKRDHGIGFRLLREP